MRADKLAVQRRRPTESGQFAWPRYWLPRDHEAQSWGGPFLYDPEDRYGHIFSEHARRLDQLADRPLLILLGEPGAGKSTAVRQDVSASGTGREVIELWRYETSHELRQVLRDASASIQQGEIVLDGADESRIRHLLGTTIGDWLSRDLPSNVRLRITMRTSTLTSSFEEQLATACIGRGIRPEVWVLAPLRERDVEEAASELGFDFEAFRSEINRVGAAHFAVLAGRLAAMAKAYALSDPNRLAESLWAMHENEVRASVDSKRAAIGAPSPRSAISVTDTVRLLGRIATVSMLSGKPSLWIDRDSDAPARSLSGGDLSDPSSEEDWGDGVSASELAIARALHVGPFRPGGSSGEIAWAQRPVAEFLAAKYLHDREVPLVQVRQLLVDAESGRVPSQLHGLAAMLCSKPGTSEDFVRMFAERDPHVAIRGDLLNVSEDARQYVAERLLELTAAHKLTYSESSLQGLYYRLANPMLAGTLRRVVTDRSADESVREMAIEMAQECCLEDLAEDLAVIVFEEGNPDRVRGSSARALSMSLKNQTRLLLLPALGREADGRRSQDDAGHALRALWPRRLISLSQVLDAITPSSESPHYPLEGFLHGFLETVPDGGVPELLHWTRNLPVEALHRSYRDLVDGLIRRALVMAEDGEVRHALILPMLRFAESVRRNGGWEWLRESGLAFETRFALARDLWQKHQALKDKEHAADWYVSGLVMGERGLIEASDFFVLLDRAAESPQDRATALFFAVNLGKLHPFSQDPEHIQAVLGRRESYPEFDATFGFLWSPWDLKDERVQGVRASHFEMIERQKRESRPVRRKGVPAPRPKRRKLITAFENGERDAYWKLLHQLALNQHGWYEGNVAYRDVKGLPGWKEEDEDFRARVVAASARFLSVGGDRPERWVGKRKLFDDDAAAYRALRLLRAEGIEPDEDAYRRWSVALAAFPSFVSDDEHETIVRKAVAVDPVRTEAALLICLDADAKANGYCALGAYVRRELNSSLGDRLLELSNGWPGVARLRVIEEALLAGSTLAREMAIREFDTAHDGDHDVDLACTIATRGGAEAWDAIRFRMERDEEFGRRFLVKLGDKYIHWKEEAVSHLDLSLREWLLGWIEDRFPSPGRDGSRSDARGFQDALLTSIWNAGSAEAVAAVDRIKARYPTMKNIDVMALHAQLRALEDEWEWNAPSELRALLRDPTKSLIRNSADLQIAIVRSLEALEKDLLSTGMSWALWNEGKKGERPRLKSEERFSDLVCAWLRRDLDRIAIVANREVQPRRRNRLDILVEVRSTYPSREVSATVIVEAKLATYTETLWTGMQRQLIDEYLAKSGSKYGIYLIGYVYGPKFDEKPGDGKPFGLAEWKSYWDQEAVRHTTSQHAIRSFVMDISLS